MGKGPQVFVKTSVFDAKAASQKEATQKDDKGLRTVEGELLMAVTALDLVEAYFKNRFFLRAVQNVGSNSLCVINSTFLLRKMLTELGFKELDIRRAMGDAGKNLDLRTPSSYSNDQFAKEEL